MSERNVCPVCHRAGSKGETKCAACGLPFAYARCFADEGALKAWQSAARDRARKWTPLKEAPQVPQSNGRLTLSIAKSSMAVLNLDTKRARLYSPLGGSSVFEDVVLISQSDTHCLLVLSNGTVKATGNNERQACNVTGLKGIRYAKASVHASYYVDADGKVVCRGSSPYMGILESWAVEIRQIACGKDHLAWLQSDGKVFIAAETNGSNQALCVRERLAEEREGWMAKVYKTPSDWKNIIAIEASENYLIALDDKGMVRILGDVGGVTGQPAFGAPAQAIAASRDYALALMNDGRVLCHGKSHALQCENDIQATVQGWRDIATIAASGTFAAAIDQTGQLRLVGSGMFRRSLIDNRKWLRADPS